MGRQIRFYSCDVMCEAIASAAARLDVHLVETYCDDPEAIQWSRAQPNGLQEGRLWTQAKDARPYEALRRAVKKDATFDKPSGLWVKDVSWPDYEQDARKRQAELDRLIQSNREYAVDVLGARVVREDADGLDATMS